MTRQMPLFNVNISALLNLYVVWVSMGIKCESNEEQAFPLAALPKTGIKHIHVNAWGWWTRAHGHSQKATGWQKYSQGQVVGSEETMSQRPCWLWEVNAVKAKNCWVISRKEVLVLGAVLALQTCLANWDLAPKCYSWIEVPCVP